MAKVGIITFHDTPNYGATLQCYATSAFLTSEGCEVEVINYTPPYTTLQYVKSLFLGKRRGIGNLKRIALFRQFVKNKLRLSGPPVLSPRGLGALSRRYDVALTGSDEVWKVDHMRRLDPSYYLHFCDKSATRIISNAASASTVTDLRKYAATVRPLLERFDAIAVRDPHTGAQVHELIGIAPELVVDPTFLWDWHKEELPPVLDSKYIAVYSWLSDAEMREVKALAAPHGLKVVCVGCRHPDADKSMLGVGPTEWLRLIRHADLVVTNFFHGVVFALLFGRPLYAHVDTAKKMKLARIVELAGIPNNLHDGLNNLNKIGLQGCKYDHLQVLQNFEPMINSSKQYLRAQILKKS